MTEDTVSDFGIVSCHADTVSIFFKYKYIKLKKYFY